MPSMSNGGLLRRSNSVGVAWNAILVGGTSGLIQIANALFENGRLGKVHWPEVASCECLCGSLPVMRLPETHLVVDFPEPFLPSSTG